MPRRVEILLYDGPLEVFAAIQLGIEYDPQPPFDSGSPRTADPQLVELLTAHSDLVVGPR